MQIDLFLCHLAAFHQEFQIDTSPAARADKLTEEYHEFMDAMQNGTDQQADEEALDVLVCAIANCTARGYKDPLHHAYLKLQRTAVKYRAKQADR